MGRQIVVSKHNRRKFVVWKFKSIVKEIFRLTKGAKPARVLSSIITMPLLL